MGGEVRHQEIDPIAVIGSFLANVDLDDLVVELVQNELDAGSSRTHIHFGKNALTCEGDGAQIDQDGWRRLRQVVGAGGRVAPKEDGIGAKNHGLRTGYWLGDEIIVQSAQNRMRFLLYGDGRSKPVNPVAMESEDPSAPVAGTRITIAYRRKEAFLNTAEGLTLEAVSIDRLGKTFDGALHLSKRLLSAVSASQGRYELSLQWADKPPHLFRFSRAAGRIAGWPSLLRRSAVQEGAEADAEWQVREFSLPFEIDVGRSDRGRVPRLFRLKDKVVGELSFAVNERGRPIPEPGKLRYPIGYPDGQAHAYTGFGFHISGPFHSDTQRHGLAGDLPRNRCVLAAAQAAMVTYLREQLLPRYGVQALALLRRPDLPDPEAERLMAARLLGAGALLVHQPSVPADAPVLLARGATVVLVVRFDRPDEIADDLFDTVPRTHGLLASGTPPFLVTALNKLDSSKVRIWTDLDAVGELVVEDDGRRDRLKARRLSRDRRDWIDRRLQILQAIQNRDLSLSQGIVQDLQTRALFPTADGGLATWQEMQRSTDDVPEVGGVQRPILLCRELSRLRIFREGPLQLKPFGLDTYISNLDFDGAADQSRQSFIEWLVVHHARLRYPTVKRVAEYRVWPTARGSHCALSEMVAPRSAALAKLLREVTNQPSAWLLAQGIIGGSASSAFYIRATPTEAELEAWYELTSDQIKALADGEDREALRASVVAQEQGLLLMMDHERLSPRVSEIAYGHHTLSRTNVLTSIEDLHLPVRKVLECRLDPGYLPALSNERLYQRLDIQRHASSIALIDALENDAKGGDLLFRRLAALDECDALDEVETRAILPIGGKLLRPDQVALPVGTVGAELWGGWKVIWAIDRLTPERQQLLVKAGVARQLTEALSVGFFSWLQTKDATTLETHIRQVMRHWRDGARGPLKWWTARPTLRCLLVRGRGDLLELVSNQRAVTARSPIYLPDFPQIQEQILERDAVRRLAITDVEGVSGTVFQALKRAKVKSLKASVGAPRSLSVASEVPAPDVLARALRRLRSGRMSEELPKRLERQDISEEWLRPRWRTLVKKLTDVRSGRSLWATFVFGGRSYESRWASGVETRTGSVWVDASGETRMDFYAALAEHLLDLGAPPSAPYAMMQAIETPFSSVSSAKVQGGAWGGSSGDDDEDEKDLDAAIAGGDLKAGHGIASQDFAPVTPEPKPFKSNRNYTDAKHRHPKSPPSRSGSGTDRFRNSPEEAEEIEALKRQHYGLHCQACLGAHEPAELALPQTYLWLGRFRRGILEAHHVDHLQNAMGAARGAGNLLILCEYHHQLVGDGLVGDIVRQALREATPLTRHFASGDGSGEFKFFAGLLAAVTLDREPFRIGLYFTKEHAEAWRRRAAP